jgi:hypothetical protein
MKKEIKKELIEMEKVEEINSLQSERDDYIL